MRLSTVAVSLCALAFGAAWADDEFRLPRNTSFTTLSVTPFAIEGLTGDAAGNLYTTGRQPDTTKNCPLWRGGVDGSRTTLGFVPDSPSRNPSGVAFGPRGGLYFSPAGAHPGGSGGVFEIA